MNKTELAETAALAAELAVEYSKKAGLDGWEVYLASGRSMSLEAKDGPDRRRRPIQRDRAVGPGGPAIGQRGHGRVGLHL